MNRKMEQYRLVWEWRMGVGYRHTVTLCAMMKALSTTTIHAEYVTLWAKAEGGAITPLGEGNGDDEKGPSPGNCTECEVWDDYNEECVPLREYTGIDGEPCKECDGTGSARNKEEGATIDGEQCKECDGQGEVRNREDGSRCIWHQHGDAEFLGCCYSGNCTIVGQCYVIEEKGDSNAPVECPACLANSDTMYVPTCPSKKETYKYGQAKTSCAGHQDYRVELIPYSKVTNCEMTMYSSQIIRDILEAAYCIIECGRFLSGLEPTLGAGCYICLTSNDWEPCDVVKSCDAGTFDCEIPGPTHIPEGGPCP